MTAQEIAQHREQERLQRIVVGLRGVQPNNAVWLAVMDVLDRSIEGARVAAGHFPMTGDDRQTRTGGLLAALDLKEQLEAWRVKANTPL